MENENPAQPPANPGSAPVMPPGPSVLENKPPASPLPKPNEPSHPFPPPNTSPEKPPFWKSKWLILGILLLAILVPAGVFTLAKVTSESAPTPTPTLIETPAPTVSTPSPSPVDETANWKTYSDNGKNYTIKYPDALQPVNLEDTNDPYSDCAYLGEPQFETNPNSQTMGMCLFKEKFSTIYPDVASNPNYTKVNINGYIAYKLISGQASLSQADVYVLNTDESFVAFTQITLIDKNLFEKVISTFKFTK